MSNSKIEQLILDKNFSYLQPYFYNNPYALRCELGIGEDEQFIANAKKRALEIYNILFPRGADAIIFNYWIFDYSDSGEPFDVGIENALKSETEQLRFLLEYQSKYRHHVVRGLETYGEFPDQERRNRIICYADKTGFDYNGLIDGQISGYDHEVSFVSFENECIFSIYDDRGCDIVFATPEKMKEFYTRLEPYFLEYDAEEMKKRFSG